MVGNGEVYRAEKKLSITDTVRVEDTGTEMAAVCALSGDDRTVSASIVRRRRGRAASVAAASKAIQAVQCSPARRQRLE
jgi:hypothetical protein